MTTDPIDPVTARLDALAGPPNPPTRGPYEITVTHAGESVTTTVTLTPETNRARAIANGRAQLAESNPGTHVKVHRWEKGARSTAEPTDEQLEYHASIDGARMIHRHHPA